MNRFLNDIFSGEYCSDLISSVWYGKDGVIKDNTKYSYDEKGNITKIFENGTEKVRYTYDELSRLIREDNKELNKTFIFSYDNGGNIVDKFETVYTLANIDNIVKETITAEDIANDKQEYGFSLRKLSKLTKYGYSATGWKDLLLSVDDENIEYDSLGNPTTYRDSQLKWNYLRNLEKIGDIATYKYNASGIRTSKIVDSEETKFYLNGNKVVAQDDETNRFIFYYGIDGLTGFLLNGVEYVYKKNIQNDIIGIYDINGNQLVKYVYDAWGNHKTFVLYQGNFVDISLENDYNDDNYQGKVQLATLNPFRYRSYYFDEETGLYYLNTRYYDPEIGRFINADSISILSEGKDLFNGLNLFVYCNDNPINNTDENGASWWDKFWKGLLDVLSVIVVAAVVIGLTALSIATAGAGSVLLGVAIGVTAMSTAAGAISGAFSAITNGTSFAAGVFGGAIRGFGTGAAIGLGIMTGGGAIGAIPALLGAVSLNYLTGSLAYVVENGLNGQEISWKGAMISGGLQALTSLFDFGTGFIMGGLGIYNVPGNGLLNVLKTEGLKKLFTSVAFRNILGGFLLKSVLLWPISNLLRSIQKQNLY